MRFLCDNAAFLTVLIFTFVCSVCEGCNQDDIVRGCKIEEGKCTCGVGCLSEFRYSNGDECQSALRGKSRDACQRNPCANNGACIQTTTTTHRYKCRCEGTGYYGPRCQYACPKPGSPAVKVYPYECIEI